MMLECQNPSCRKRFLHAATETQFTYNGGVTASNVYIHSADHMVVSQREVRVCPYCGEKDLQEVSEVLESMKSVDINEVDGFLKQGYTVKESFSNKATIVKKAKA